MSLESSSLCPFLCIVIKPSLSLNILVTVLWISSKTNHSIWKETASSLCFSFLEVIRLWLQLILTRGIANTLRVRSDFCTTPNVLCNLALGNNLPTGKWLCVSLCPGTHAICDLCTLFFPWKCHLVPPIRAVFQSFSHFTLYVSACKSFDKTTDTAVWSTAWFFFFFQDEMFPLWWSGNCRLFQTSRLNELL